MSIRGENYRKGRKARLRGERGYELVAKKHKKKAIYFLKERTGPDSTKGCGKTGSASQ